MARRLAKEQIISNVYNDVEGCFGSIQETFKKAKQQNITKPRNYLRWSKASYEKVTQQTKIQGYRGYNSCSAPICQMGVSNWQNANGFALKKSRSQNISKKEPRYALVVIDIFRKFADIVPMTENNSESEVRGTERSI